MGGVGNENKKICAKTSSVRVAPACAHCTVAPVYVLLVWHPWDRQEGDMHAILQLPTACHPLDGLVHLQHLRLFGSLW